MIEGAARGQDILWFNDTFTWHEHNFPTGMLLQEATDNNPGDHLHDVSSVLPTGVPILLHLEGDWGSSQAGNLQLRTHAPADSTVYQWNQELHSTGARIDMVVKHQGSNPFLIGIRNNSPGERAEIEYSLHLRVSQAGPIIPAGVPVAFDAGGVTAIEVEATGAKPAQFLLWDENDEVLFRGESGRLYNLTTSGEHVLVANADCVLRADHPTAGPLLRALDEETVEGASVTAEPAGLTRWDFTLDRIPLKVSVALLESVAVQDIAVQVTGPNGPVVDAHQNGTMFLSDWWWESDKLHAGLVEGEYEASWTNAAAVEVHLAERVTYYRR